MIDWLNLFFNALWIIALSIALATLSYQSWAASENGTRLRDELETPGAQLALNIAGILFCAGLALTSERAWEIAAWALLGLAFLWQIISPRIKTTKTMSLSKEEVQHIAQLARLELSAEELETYRGQLSDILQHVAQLSELDTEGIAPTSSVLPQRSVLRKDKARPGLGADKLGETAPEWENDQFKVPPILD
jgi:aspartyl-tRNA(Asn)/glutamyl-tRNA(Gln) amidotransferase subunit C